MTSKTKHFYQKLFKCIISIFVLICINDVNAASVAARGKPTAAKNAARASTASKTKKSEPAVVANETTTETVAKAETETYTQPLTNKANMFSDAFGSDGDDDDDETRDMLARIAAFRAGKSNDDIATTGESTRHDANKCDAELRKCMINKCGDGFQKCAGDTDTIWGDKMDACRRNTTCTGHEYALFAPEIAADRDVMQQLSLYEGIMNCGNRYNDCIVGACGKTFEKCVGKNDGDAAIKKCEQIAKECTEQDSGLAARAMQVMGTARNTAEYTIEHDMERLYALRDELRSTCERLGAAFDERTFSCVFTVNFHAGEDDSIYASKKAYAGSTFDCNQNWFGVDVTTFMENAFRLTRSQTSASSAMLGSGLGMAAGAVTSGAIDRAVDRAKAERDYKEELCGQTGGKWNKTTKLCKCPKTQKYDKETGCTNDLKKWLKNNNCTDDSSDEECRDMLSKIKESNGFENFSWGDQDNFDQSKLKDILGGIFNK